MTFTERSESSASAYPVDDDLYALQPFQQLGTSSIIVLVLSAVMAPRMKCLDKLIRLLPVVL